MTRILLLGENHPIMMGDAKIEAAHYRTAQFLESLLEDGHTITLVAPRIENADPSIENHWHGRLSYQPIDFNHIDWKSELQQIHDFVKPHCVVAVNLEFCLYATKLTTSVPIWMDIYGDPITIMQAAVYRAGSDRGLKTFMGFVRLVLEKGDIFSVCGTPQKHMLVGELAMIGRVNRYTFGYEFGHAILPGAFMVTETAKRSQLKERKLLSQAGVPEDAFVVLWAGGYNTWTDVDTLFNGLVQAMDAEKRLVYVSVGASTYEAPDNVYVRFQQLIAASSHRDRFYLLGWRPWSEVAGYYRESDVGINIDSQHYETVYGTRTRLVEMIGEGLPIVTSFGTELGSLLVNAGAALGFSIGDRVQLGNHLTKLAADPEHTQKMSANALAFAKGELSIASTTKPIREWVKAPQRAPDRVGKTPQQKITTLEYEARARMRWLLWRYRGAFR